MIVDTTQWVALLTPIAVAVLTVVNVVTAKITADRAAHSAQAVQEVKITLATSVEDAADRANEIKLRLERNNSLQYSKLDDIHKLVNNSYAVSLRIGAAALERVAAITKNPDDISQAKIARQLSTDHDRKQLKVDADNRAAAAKAGIDMDEDDPVKPRV